MASIPSKYLLSNSSVGLRDAQHAARLFVDDGFRLAPKHKFLFHVAFGINEAALKTIDLAQRHRNEINMLVKTVDMPKFTIQTEVLNQYNRKKVMQYTHKPEVMNIKFHDDNMGLINNLWQNYYSYYYADPLSAKKAAAYNRNATRSSDFINTAYGLDNRSTIPFFNYITVYQMARHEWNSYTLKNPLITAWGHGTGSYSDTGVNEKTMSISYEAVAYDQGVVSQGSPEGFALEHYDQTPSPLSSNTGFTGASPSFSSNINVSGNAQEFISNVTSQINTYQNTQQLANPGKPGVLTNIIQTANQGVSGVQGTRFPISNAVSTATTIATAVKFLGS